MSLSAQFSLFWKNHGVFLWFLFLFNPKMLQQKNYFLFDIVLFQNQMKEMINPPAFSFLGEQMIALLRKRHLVRTDFPSTNCPMDLSSAMR